jgi:hypothetical protein
MPVRLHHGLDSDEDWPSTLGRRHEPASFLKDWEDSDGTRGSPGARLSPPDLALEIPLWNPDCSSRARTGFQQNPDCSSLARAAPSVFYRASRSPERWACWTRGFKIYH